jgi:hypothetical protein
MKRIACLSLTLFVLTVVSCKKDYRKDIVGNWDAGKATQKNEILVTIRPDGSLTSMITESGMKPMNGTWIVEGDNVTFRFPGLDLSYRILTLNESVMVMKWKFAKITWHRMK